MDKAEEFSIRLSNYAGDVLLLLENFPTSRSVRHVEDQLIRSATAPGAHYGEARGAQSGKDFIYKISLALKELRESMHWLRVARRARWIADEPAELLDEAEQLCRMLGASKRTARRSERDGR